MEVDTLTHAIIRDAAEQNPLYLTRPFHYGRTATAARALAREEARDTRRRIRVATPLGSMIRRITPSPAPSTARCCAVAA